MAEDADAYYAALKKRLTPVEATNILGKLAYVAKGARMASERLEELAYRSEGCTPENTSTPSE